MCALMSPMYAKETLASTLESSTATATTALALGNAWETTGRPTASGNISRNSQADVVQGVESTNSAG